MERFSFNAAGILVQAAFSSIALAAFWCALRRLTRALPGSTNRIVLVVIVATILLNILWAPVALLFQMGCLMLGLASIPMWLISLFTRKKTNGLPHDCKGMPTQRTVQRCSADSEPVPNPEVRATGESVDQTMNQIDRALRRLSWRRRYGSGHVPRPSITPEAHLVAEASEPDPPQGCPDRARRKTMKKLGGWTRLGVVLSVLWCIGVVVNAAIQYQDMVEEQKEPHSPSFTAKDMNRVYGASFFEWRDPKPWEMNWSNEVPATSGPKREKTTPIAQSEQPPRFEDTFPIDASSPSGYTPKGQFLDGEQPAFQSPAPSAPATPPPTRKKDIFDELEGKQPAPSPSRPLLKPFDPDAYLAKTKAVIGFRIKPAPLLAVAFGPIAAAWLTLLGVTATVRWVRQGFRSRRCDSAPESRSAGVTGAAAPAIQGPHRHWRDMYWMRINWPQRVVLVLGMVAFLAWGVAWFGTGINLENERRQVVRYIAPRFFELLAGWLMAALPTAALFFVFKSRESKPTGDV